MPNLFVKAPELYRNLTIDASGLEEPWSLERAGKHSLGWAYGINNDWAKGPDYWTEICGPEYRMRRCKGGKPLDSVKPPLCRSGIALDEWTNAVHNDAERWAAEGLRAGRKQHPDVFIAAWATELTDTLAGLARDGTVDLVILECYSHAPARLGEGEVTAHWETTLRRCEQVRAARISHKSIVCFGHVTDEPDKQGKTLSTEAVERQVRDIHKRYPEMAGVAFYQATEHDSPELRRLVKFCDELSGELWPDGGKPSP